MRRTALLLPAVAVWGCVTLTPEGARVAVYTAKADAPPALRQMPDGCRRLSELPADFMSELDMEGQSDPFRKQRNTAGAAGGNVLLVLKMPTGSRTDVECPGGSPITDCAPSSGATFALTFQSYSCTPEALKALATPKNL